MLKILFEMKFLMEYKITYENVNLMVELDHQISKVLAMKIEKKRRMLAVMTKMTKDKRYPRQVLCTIGEEFFM